MQALEILLFGCLQHKPNTESHPAATQVHSKTLTELTKMRVIVWSVQLLPHRVAGKEYTHMITSMILFGLPDVQNHRYNSWVELFPFFLKETMANLLLLQWTNP